MNGKKTVYKRNYLGQVLRHQWECATLTPLTLVFTYTRTNRDRETENKRERCDRSVIAVVITMPVHVFPIARAMRLLPVFFFSFYFLFLFFGLKSLQRSAWPITRSPSKKRIYFISRQIKANRSEPLSNQIVRASQPTGKRGGFSHWKKPIADFFFFSLNKAHSQTREMCVCDIKKKKSQFWQSWI